MIKLAHLNVSIQKKRKDSIVKQSRADIAQLLQNGQLDQAFARVRDLLVLELHKSQAFGQGNIWVQKL